MIKILYVIGVRVVIMMLPIIGIFSKKVRNFIKSRSAEKTLFSNFTRPKGLLYWFHCASLGEYEQAKPIIDKLRRQDSAFILITFFSPSGYEVVKPKLDGYVYVGYLPLENRRALNNFLDKIKPNKVFWIKYELWLITLHTIFERKIPVYLTSASFTKQHFVLKFWAGKWRNLLRGFSNIFVQNEESQSILNVLGLKSIVAGDTRFDNVLRITKEGYTNEKIANWKGKDTLLVLGSSWHREEQLLIAYLSENASAKAIIAPHDISDGHLKEVVSLLEEQHISFAYWDDVITDSIQVIIINNIGILSKVYCYADIAVVGGGFKTKGLHNILEPLAWGVPVVTGPNITNNWEAVAAEKELLLMIVADSKEFEEALESLKKSENHATKARLFVSKYTNATELICQTV